MNNCQVFTPAYIVDLMLDMVGYTGDAIKNKTIFEPSFGDGAFLTAIVKRILKYSTAHNLSDKEILNILDNVYAVEIDKKYYDITICKLNDILFNHNLKYNWTNIVCGNTLHYSAPIKFDIIVANPPYQRVMHMDLATRSEIETKYKFGAGNTDLYVIFFEYCLNMAKPDSKLCFITPNSYFKNSSQASFREYLADNNLVDTIIDYCNVKVFDSIATYTAVILLEFGKKSPNTKYIMMKSETEEKYQSIVNLKLSAKNPWVFTNPEDTKFIEEIRKRKTKLKDLCDIQHGIATNADKVYIVSRNDIDNFEDDILRPVTKASTLNSDNKIIFPYIWSEKAKRYVVIEEKVMQEKYPKTYKYLLENRHILDKRDMEKREVEWYQYARSQGIQNSSNRKFALKHIINGDNVSCEIKELDDKALVYSGIYIVVKDDKNYEKVKNILLSKEFHKYLFLVGKDMAGGYRNVSAKFIKEYGIEQ